jgi:hypothetical protein
MSTAREPWGSLRKLPSGRWLSRPGVSGDWIPWKDDGHGTSLEVPARAA